MTTLIRLFLYCPPPLPPYFPFCQFFEWNFNVVWNDMPSVITFLSDAMLSQTREISNMQTGNTPEMNALWTSTSLSWGYAREFLDI